MLIVQKFGGSSVADPEKVRRVAGIIADAYSEGHQLVVVLSAQGDTTDELLEKAALYNPNPSKRELDMLLSTGEQISVALMAMTLESMGLPVVSLCGWQIGMQTNSTHGAARIKRIHAERLQRELDRRRIVLVAGFQGINKYDDVTTLGRGGSDTTAVAIAAAIQADKCQIFTDVDGVYTADPRKVQGARKLEQITFDEMLELATLGAQVLHNRSVEMAKRYSVNLEVLSSYVRKPGTIVKEVTKKVEQMRITGVAKDTNVTRIAVVGLPDEPGKAYKVLSILGKIKVNVDLILQSVGKDGSNDLSFTVNAGDAPAAVKALEDAQEVIGFEKVSVDNEVAKISIVGAGMLSTPGIAAMMFEALAGAKINVKMITSSEIKLSVLIDKAYADLAVQKVHDRFFGEAL